MTRQAWLAASVVASVVSVLIAVSGGLVASVGGVRISARSWHVSAVAALGMVSLWAWLAVRRGSVREDLQATGDWLERNGGWLAAGISAGTAIAALVFATRSASGADASGYLSQAAMWARLADRVGDPLVTLPGWPLAPGDTAPLGWRPAREAGWQVPTYAPGLPWLMALPHAIGGTAGACAVIAASAGLAVLAASALAWRLGGGCAALVAGLLIATSPTFLYQAFQPMSDVPVTAAWATCWWLVAERRFAGAGVAAGVAVLVRPNLAPLAALPWIAAVWDGPPAARRRRAWTFALPVAAAGAAIAVVQWHWYGSPLASGYGTASELFTLANVLPNARLYASWLWDAEPAFVLLALCAAAAWGQARLSPNHRSLCAVRRASILGLGFAAGVTMAYLVYAVFETWSYVRFLLPAMAVVAAITGGAIATAARRLTPALHGTLVLALVIAASAGGLHRARSLGVFQVAAVTARARDLGEQLARTLPPHAVLLAGEQSGSMRYATGRPTVRWETLDATSLRATLHALRAHGYEPWWVLDQFEEARVRTRFAGVPEAALDGPPDLEAGPLMRTRAWRIGSLRGDGSQP